MEGTKFYYVTYVSATPEKIWDAITNPAVTAKYWYNVNISDWKPGSRWEHRHENPQGRVKTVGRILEVSRPWRLAMTWADPADEAREERHSRVAIEIEPVGEVTRVTVTHDQLEPDSEMHRKIADGWPKVLSSLKTLMETGRPLPMLWGEPAASAQGKQTGAGR